MCVGSFTSKVDRVDDQSSTSRFIKKRNRPSNLKIIDDAKTPLDSVARSLARSPSPMELEASPAAKMFLKEQWTNLPKCVINTVEALVQQSDDNRY